jgi:two-component system NtrC family sensor kinase
MPDEAEAVAPDERPAPRTRLGHVVAAGQPSSESGQFEKLAVDLQLALRELAEARSKVPAASDDAPSATSAGPSQAETIAGVSRSLREPMMSVVGYTDLLLGESVGLLGQMQRKFLERVRAGLRRSEDLLNQLAELTAEADRPAQATRPVDLRKAFDEAMERTAGSIRTRGQSVLGELPSDLPLVRAEENALLQILVHLLTNASGATPPAGQIVVRSATHPASAPAFVQLSIQDGGSGIPAPDLLRVFHTQQREAARIPGIAEEGADLAMVRALTETVGGRVWLESEVGKGTTMSVILPLAEATPEPAPARIAAKPTPEQSEPPERSPA